MKVFEKRSNFAQYIQRRQFYEAFLEYMTNEDAFEEELQKLKQSPNKDEYIKYCAVWNSFREYVIRGEFDQAQSLLANSPYKRDMGILEAKSILNDLADKTGNFNCYEMFWRLCGEDTVFAHDEAISLLNSSLAGCPESKPKAREHLWWIINNTSNREKLKYAELGLEYFLKPNSFVTSEEAAEFITIARKINPKSKGALKTEYALFDQDKAALAKIRPLLNEKLYDEAFEILGGVENDQIRRTLMRGAHENKSDAILFVNALKELYRQTRDPRNAYSAALAIWNSDVRKNPEELNWSMDTALAILDELPHRSRAAATVLDALYLMDPYPLADETAKVLAESVLQENPENEIALECLAIIREQAKSQK